MIKTFDFISDPGHGWVKVPISLLQDLCISKAVSNYSYVRGAYAYLVKTVMHLYFTRLSRTATDSPQSTVSATRGNDAPVCGVTTNTGACVMEGMRDERGKEKS